MTIHWKNGAPRCVFISGGGSGIGREFAMRLAGEGAHVALFNRRPAPHVVAELRRVAVRSDQRFESYSADVSDDAAIQAAILQAVQDLGAPDLAINSAGIQIAVPFELLTSADFNQVINVNLIGSRNFAAAVLPHLRQGSHLVLVASLAGLTGNFAYAAYCASKFGTVGLASVLRIELKLKGIDVSVCCPAEIDTPLVVEERKTLHPISAALKDFAGTLDVQSACDSMLKGIARRDFEIIPGFMPKLTAFLNRHVPGITQRVSDGIAAKTLKRIQKR
ncbi:MAG: SDR family NAD(P)-dependent oxidoreductase [Parvibaculum sp.]|nr:SDR family NAD(P)-dependent oxidoreductase [Parvibaculum sp.]